MQKTYRFNQKKKRREQTGTRFVSSSCCDFIVDFLSSLAAASTAAKYADWLPVYLCLLRCVIAVLCAKL